MSVRLPNPWGKFVPNLAKSLLTIPQKQWLVDEIIHHGKSAAEVGAKYSLSRNTISKWVSKCRKGSILHEKGGRPEVVTLPIETELRRRVTGGIHNITTADFETDLQKLHRENVVATTKTAECSVRPISRRSVGRLKTKLKLKKAKAEQTTDARALATADKLNSVSIAAAHYLMVPLTSPHLMINADGTSYATGGGLTSGIDVYFLEDSQKGATLKVPAQKDKTLTSYFIKYYMCMTATGVTAAPIYICADENMKEGTIDVHEIPGLGIGQDITATGWVVFSKTRSVNEEFYRWWFTTIFTKFVIDLRCTYDLSDEVPAYFNLDGEDVQIKPFKSPAIQALCKEMNIIIGKPPASTTSISQPCDAGKVFMASKTKNKHIKRVKDIPQAAMNTKLRQVLLDHDAITGKKFKSHHIKSLILGLQIVQYILQTTLRKDTIMDSFEITGQYMKATGKCSVEKILGQCKQAFTTEEVTKVWSLLPTLCDVLKLRGELQEKDFLPLGMSDETPAGKKSRDELVLNRRRFCFLTHPSLVMREAQKADEKGVVLEDRALKAAKRKSDAEARRLNPPAKKARRNAAVAVVAHVAI